MIWTQREGLIPKTLAALVLAAVIFAINANSANSATTFVVNDKFDSSDEDLTDNACDVAVLIAGDQCTLRAAIEQANATSGADTINFNIPDDPSISGDEVRTISPVSALPNITEQVTINGYSQPGASPNTLAVGDNAVLKIELNGSGMGAAGLTISAGSSTVRGLVINRFFGVAIDLRTGSNNTVAGNFIGTDPTGSIDQGNNFGVVTESGSNTNTIGGATPGARNILSGNFGGLRFESDTNKAQGNYIGTKKNGTEALPNSEDGVYVFGDTNVIGGATAGERNVISGNGQDGVEISGDTNQVQGNYIGTRASGTEPLGNGRHGVFVDGGFFFSNNTIGRTATGTRNVISGNAQDGVSIVGDRASNTSVQGNFIGTDKDGTKRLGNGNDGVEIDNSDNNTIGGTVAGARNVISGNSQNGVLITSFTGRKATGNNVQGNYIGTDKNGIANLGNNSFGVSLQVAANSTIGGTANGSGNTIAFNASDGVVVLSGTGNRILRDSIFSNGGVSTTSPGIDLNNDGVTANDVGDGDTGPNNLQNFPMLNSARTSRRGTTIKGQLISAPSTIFTLQFFRSPQADPSGNGEGMSYLGQKSVTTDASGNATFTFKTKKKVGRGQVVTATATDPNGNTSEFSAVQ